MIARSWLIALTECKDKMTRLGAGVEGLWDHMERSDPGGRCWETVRPLVLVERTWDRCAWGEKERYQPTMVVSLPADTRRWIPAVSAQQLSPSASSSVLALSSRASIACAASNWWRTTRSSAVTPVHSGYGAERLRSSITATHKLM